MDLTLLGVVIGAIVILFLVRGVGFYMAKQKARETYERALTEEIRPRNRIRVAEPRRPEQVYLTGENRYETGPGMEAPPVYSKADSPPAYTDIGNVEGTMTEVH